jgi:hypothetical protein
MANEANFHGRTAIVTGASSGIGRSIATQLAAAGAHVFLAGRTASALEEAAFGIKRSGGSATPVKMDVRDVAQVQRLVDDAVRATGHLEIMVNNAGVEFPSTIADGDPERWREMLETNILALLVGSQAAIRAMRGCKAQGHIVNISSSAALSEPTQVYGATKWAVNGISRMLRKELENDTIRVVNIMPGATVTNFARNFPPEFVQGIAAMVGIKADFKPGEHLAQDVLEKVVAAAKPILAAPDDVGRAVVYAVSQPIELNVFEMVVRPQRQLPLA